MLDNLFAVFNVRDAEISTARGVDALQPPKHRHPLGRSRNRRATRITNHVCTEDGNRKIMIASFRHLGAFAKLDERRFFAEHKLVLDWSETRLMSSAVPG